MMTKGGVLTQSDLGSNDGSIPSSRVWAHPVFEALSSTSEDNVSLLSPFLEGSGASNLKDVNLEDENGMTLLMYAAWKGKINTAEFLIKQGADVNGGHHEHDYSALHFAALAGKEKLCQLLVEHGAKIDAINSVKRTAAQMAAFVGNAPCVSIINNFVPKEDIFYFAKKQPLEKEARMPTELAKPMHKLVMTMNTHPVRVALILKETPQLLQNIAKVTDILEMMSDRQFKDRRDVNEVLSLKFHIIHYIVKDIKKAMDKSDADKKKSPIIDLWIKSMLVGRESDNYPVFQEDFLRQGIKEFPYQESQLFKMLVTNFSHCTKYGEGVTAAEYINQAFNGQQGFKDFENCDSCGNPKAEKKCSGCKSVQYCDQVCQKLHWFGHKKFCPALKELFLKREAMAKANGSKPEES